MLTISAVVVYHSFEDLARLLFRETTNQLSTTKVISLNRRDISIMDLISGYMALMVSICWYFTELWIFNNAIVICLIIALTKWIKIQSLIPGVMLIIVFTAFDALWMGISPYLFDGHNILREISKSQTSILKFQIPPIGGDLPISSCATYTVIDLAVPILFLSFLHRYSQ